MRKEEVKFSLFADAMILYTEEAKHSTENVKSDENSAKLQNTKSTHENQ